MPSLNDEKFGKSMFRNVRNDDFPLAPVVPSLNIMRTIVVSRVST
jgi:hypothetical protein